MEKRAAEEVAERAKSWQLKEIMDPNHCRLVMMPDNTDTSSKVRGGDIGSFFPYRIRKITSISIRLFDLNRNPPKPKPRISVASFDVCCMFFKVVRLLYTNSGVGVLALGANGVQKLWKWARNEQNPSGKVIIASVYSLKTSIPIH